MFDVFFNHFRRNVASTADKVATSPEVLAPVAFLEFGVFHLEFPGGFTFQILYQGGDVSGRIDRDEHVNVVGSYGTREYFSTFFVADASEEFFGAVTNITLEYFVPVLGDPADMQIDGEHRV